MGRFIATYCLCFLLLTAAVVMLQDYGGLPSVGAGIASAQTSRTELMQQSDHRRRVERAKKAEEQVDPEDRQIAAFGMTEAASRDYDYVVLIMLVASVVVLAVVARRRRRRMRFRL